MSPADRAPWATALWLLIGVALPAASSAALVSVRGTVPNTDIALLIIGAVLVVATSGHRGAAALAALSAAVSFDYYHTLPYHSLTIANRNDALATLVLGLLALIVGQIAAHASSSHGELVLIAGAGVLSQAVPGPARFLVDHRGLDVSLALLVFSTALAIPPRTFRGLTTNATRLIVAVTASTTILPVLAWAASRLVPTVALRRGVLTVGVAPAEIASVATTSLAGGDTAIAAGMLVASTLIAVAGAGVGLRLLGGGTGAIHLLPLLTNLALVVGAPLAVGIAIRARISLTERQEAAAERLSVAVVTLLVWLVASQVRLSSSYLAVTGALVVFLFGSALLGAALGFRAPAPVARALLLTTSMRDFAIAAGIAVAAFGATSAAPLGLYGVIAIGWGMAVATLRPARVPDLASLVPATATATATARATVDPQLAASGGHDEQTSGTSQPPKELSPLDMSAAHVAARSLTSHREWLIAEIEAGDMRLAELQEAEEHDSRVGTVKVVSIAQAVPGVGKLQARRAMAELDIPADARWGELGPETESALWAILKALADGGKRFTRER